MQPVEPSYMETVTGMAAVALACSFCRVRVTLPGSSRTVLRMAVVRMFVVHIRPVFRVLGQERLAVCCYEAGCISLSTTHVWYVIVMQSASQLTR
ncbi:hypothetical protein BANT918_03322 [Brevibacterium antiquum CNRZ 918]|uniref:Uncharacterized protein n=1 Tax=Brevibacterium antiquum CNRZ 918 TaxID=1255637 RepID=A0A2H1L028_9MICO|nr:hypothetical protein BANT918_03322 [Brevibacterium antiquum CNRZ 918]